MNHKLHGDPRSDPRAYGRGDRHRGDDPWEGRQGEPQGYRGRADENGGYQGGEHAHGGYERNLRSDYRTSRTTGPSSTYGGLGEGPYGTHGWGRRGDGYDVDDRQFDADYLQWREQQMRELDRDYEQWRQERYRKFSEEFDQWRAARRAGGGGSGTGETSPGSASPGGSSAAAAPKTG